MNKTYIFAAVGALIGAATGAGVGYAIAKKNYEHRLAVEVDSVRASYARYIRERKTPPDFKENYVEPEKVGEEVDDYIAIAGNYDTVIGKATESQNTDYTTYANPDKVETPDISRDDSSISESYSVDQGDRPYVIPDDEYYDDDECTRIEIYYFDDGFMTDEDYDPIEEPDKIISPEALRAFSRNDHQDEIFTRVDSRHCMYCIEKQGETWEETLKRHPIILETIR